MAMVDKPNFNQPSPVGSNILPPTAPQAPPPPAAPPQGGQQSAPSPQPAQPNLQQAQPSGGGQPQAQGGGGMFDAPIPGQSLTDQPGNSKWEHPPQFTDPKKAADMVWSQLMNKRNIEQVAVMLHKGIPAEAIARTVLFGGFANGKWSPDVAMLIAKPVLYMIAAIGQQAGIDDMKITMPKDKNDPEDPINMMAQAQAQEKLAKKSQAPEDRQKNLIQGFLTRKAT